MSDGLHINEQLTIPESELEWNAIRAQGSGGQNVNKVSSAIHLRFDVPRSSLPDEIKAKLLALHDSRISKDGVLVIKAQRFRSQDKNREDALARLRELVESALVVRKSRRATKPTYGSKRKRLDSKTRRGQVKKMRERVDPH